VTSAFLTPFTFLTTNGVTSEKVGGCAAAALTAPAPGVAINEMDASSVVARTSLECRFRAFETDEKWVLPVIGRLDCWKQRGESTAAAEPGGGEGAADA
jgi:hypothetical protein